MICEKMASNTSVYEVLCVCSGCGPKVTRTKGLTYKGPSGGMMATKTGVYFGQEFSSFFFGDTSLLDFGGTFLVQFPLMDFVSLRALNNAMGIHVIIRELIPSKVGEERFGPWGDYSHDFVG